MPFGTQIVRSDTPSSLNNMSDAKLMGGGGCNYRIRLGTDLTAASPKSKSDAGAFAPIAWVAIIYCECLP